MTIFKDKNLGGWILQIGKYEILFWRWGIGVDKYEWLDDIKRFGYRNIFRLGN